MVKVEVFVQHVRANMDTDANTWWAMKTTL